MSTIDEKGVLRLRAADDGEEPAVRVPPAATPPQERRRSDGALPQATARSVRRVRPATEAWFKVAQPLRRRFGARILFFGITGKGKTHGIADFLDYIRTAGLVDLVFIHDVKEDRPQFKGKVIHEAKEAFTPEGAPTEFPATFVLRKRDLDHMPSVEAMARKTLEAGYTDVMTVAVVDEFQRALTDGGKFAAPSVARIFAEGRGLHATIIAAKQLPMDTPNVARAQSTLVLFGMNGAGASFLAEPPFKAYDQGTADVVRSLDERQFIVIPQEGDFDGQIYEVPIR